MAFLSSENMLKASDRVFVLKPIPGQVKTNQGLLDPRLFKGENNLHAIQDRQTMLWGLSYENGNLPPAFKQKFTKFQTLKDFVVTYYGRRGVEVVEVKD